jgi:hypothetical protein
VKVYNVGRVNTNHICRLLFTLYNVRYILDQFSEKPIVLPDMDQKRLCLCFMVSLSTVLLTLLALQDMVKMM